MRQAFGRATLLLSLILAIATALRLIGLGEAPAGLSHDEAYDAINSLDISAWFQAISSGQPTPSRFPPVFFDSNNGREALFMYLVSFVFSLLGVGAFQIRLVSALAGIAAVALSYHLCRELFSELRSVEWVALLCAGLYGFSFWGIFISRVGLRASLMPLMMIVLALALWRYLLAARVREERQALGWAALGGVALGLMLHTYTPARFLPLLPILFFGHIAYRRVVSGRQALYGLMALAIASLVVFLPLGLYFLQNPASFIGRAGQVNDLRFILQDGDFRPLIQDTLNTIGMFSLAGDPEDRYNLAGRPVFDAITGLFFYFGIGLALLTVWRSIRPKARDNSEKVITLERAEGTGRAPSFRIDPRDEAVSGSRATLLLLWLFVGLLPSATTGESPHFLRSVAAQPAVFVFAALGLSRSLELLVPFYRQVSFGKYRVSGGAIIAALILALNLGLGARDYFVTWNSDPEARHIYLAAYGQLARIIPDRPEERTFVSGWYPSDIDRFSLDIARGHTLPAVSWLDARQALVFPEGKTARYYLPKTAAPPSELSSRLFAGARTVERQDYYDVSLGQPFTPDPEVKVGATLGNSLELIGYDRPRDLPADGKAQIVLYWRVLDIPTRDISLFVHAIGTLGHQWAGHDLMAYPRDSWQKGDILVQWHTLEFPVGSPLVVYSLEAGGYYRDSGERLRFAADSADRIDLGSLRLTPPEGPIAFTPDVVPTAFNFGGLLSLEGYSLSTSHPHPGDRLDLTLFWEKQAAGAAPLGGDYSVFTHLVLDETQPPAAQHDGPPALGLYPTSSWRPGVIVRDPHSLALPPDLQPGRYWLLAGLYGGSGKRLAPDAAGDSVFSRLGRWLERYTSYRLGVRVSGDHLVIGAIDVRSR